MKQQQQKANQQQLDELQQNQQQPQPQSGPVNSPKNSQHEQDERVLNQQHRTDLQNQKVHSNHRE